MSKPEIERLLTRQLNVILFVLVIAGLYLAQEILLPFALAILLSFLLAPLVLRVERWGAGRAPAVCLVVVFAVGVLGGLTWVVGEQFVQVSADLPRYKENLIHKIRSARGSTTETLGRAKQTIEEIGAELSEEKATENGPKGSKLTRESASQWYRRLPGFRSTQNDDEQAVAVKVVALPPSPLQQVRTWLGPLVAPLTTAGMVIVFVIFMLLQRENLRNRVLQLLGTEQLPVSTAAIDDATARLSRYLRMQFIINLCYGVAVASGLSLIGVPNALLWGTLGVVLRFLPYIGPWIVAAMPITLSLAVFDNWTQPLLTMGLFAVLELVVNNVLEPWLYGASIGVSAVGIIISAIFWTWLWGPVGLIMATPLTVCLAVLGKHVPRLRFLDTLLSDQQPLSITEHLYQRFLAKDAREVNELIAEFQEDHTRSELFDSLLIPALQLAERDRHAERLTDEHAKSIMDAATEAVTKLANDSEHPSPRGTPAADSNKLLRVLCVPAKDHADQLVGSMVAQLIEAQGFECENVSAETMLGEVFEQVGESPVDLFLISALPPLALRYSRLACKRIHARFPQTPIVIGLWGSKRSEEVLTLLKQAGADQLVTTAEGAADLVRRKRTAMELNRQGSQSSIHQDEDIPDGDRGEEEALV